MIDRETETQIGEDKTRYRQDTDKRRQGKVKARLRLRLRLGFLSPFDHVKVDGLDDDGKPIKKPDGATSAGYAASCLGLVQGQG